MHVRSVSEFAVVLPLKGLFASLAHTSVIFFSPPLCIASHHSQRGMIHKLIFRCLFILVYELLLATVQGQQIPKVERN